MNRWFLITGIALISLAAGCEDAHDNRDTRGGRTYQPPAGMGAIVIENDTTSDWNVAIDSVQIGRVASGSFLIRDVTPGRHLIHLDVHLGREVEDRSIDVGAGLLSIVHISEDWSDYDVDLLTLSP